MPAFFIRAGFVEIVHTPYVFIGEFCNDGGQPDQRLWLKVGVKSALICEVGHEGIDVYLLNMKLKVNLKEKERTLADVKHDERLLKRIQTLVDVVYALILFELFIMFPKPEVQSILNPGGAVRDLQKSRTCIRYRDHRCHLGNNLLGAEQHTVWVFETYEQTDFGYRDRAIVLPALVFVFHQVG